jgi:hypothetical protein
MPQETQEEFAASALKSPQQLRLLPLLMASNPSHGLLRLCHTLLLLRLLPPPMLLLLPPPPLLLLLLLLLLRRSPTPSNLPARPEPPLTIS